jgi:hypothetical protein
VLASNLFDESLSPDAFTLSTLSKFETGYIELRGVQKLVRIRYNIQETISLRGSEKHSDNACITYMQSTDIRSYKYLPKLTLGCEIRDSRTWGIHLQRDRLVVQNGKITTDSLEGGVDEIITSYEANESVNSRFEGPRKYSVGGLWSRWKRL